MFYELLLLLLLFEIEEFSPFAHFSTHACNFWISEAMVQKCHSRQRELAPLHISVPLCIRVDNALYWCAMTWRAQCLPLHPVVLQALCGHASVVEYLLQLNAAPDLAGLVLQSYKALWCPVKLLSPFYQMFMCICRKEYTTIGRSQAANFIWHILWSFKLLGRVVQGWCWLRRYHAVVQ